MTQPPMTHVSSGAIISKPRQLGSGPGVAPEPTTWSNRPSSTDRPPQKTDPRCSSTINSFEPAAPVSTCSV